jgi:DNA-binding beta-propeller fold protein YncE
MYGDTQLTGRFEKIKPDTKGFLEDYSFVRDHFGKMYWANRDKDCQQVIQMDAQKNKKKVSESCFENIRWMYVSSKGELLFADFQDIVKIDRGGVKKVARQIANKQWTKSTVENQNAVFGVWDDAAGNIYTAVASNRVVKKFDQTGKEEIVFRTSIPWTPTGGLVSPSGELWVLECSDTNAVRVEKISKENKRIVY